MRHAREECVGGNIGETFPLGRDTCGERLAKLLEYFDRYRSRVPYPRPRQSEGTSDVRA